MTRLSISMLVLAGFLASPATAADHEVRMLNLVQTENGAQYMLFEPAFLKVEPGDTVTFVPTDAGHNSVSKAVPTGAEAWRSQPGQPLTVTLDQEGVYLYVCEPHLSMAMIGVVQVGTPSNLDAVRQEAESLGAFVAMNKERIERTLEQVEM